MTQPRINEHERRAWDRLVKLGAEQIEIGGKSALDLRAMRHVMRKSEGQWANMLGALADVVGHSGATRYYQDRAGRCVFVVRDNWEA